MNVQKQLKVALMGFQPRESKRLEHILLGVTVNSDLPACKKNYNK
jgi:hypothetical protein